MADEKKSGEEKDNNIPDLSDFLKEKGLLKYKDALIEAGLEEDLESLKDLDDDDIDALIKSAKLKKFHGRVLKRIIKEYKDGTYKPGPQKRLNVLREGRKDLRGVIPRKVDTFTGQKGKTIIVIGQTGVGKTTLINSMCNYLEEISYDEQFRYKLICEENYKRVYWNYRWYHLENVPALNYSAINIVDTPGFVYTEGPQKDKQIHDQFKQFFETKCPFVDGIYFIVKAHDNRISVVQKYIFNMVLDLFGKDVKENIFVLFTFSDGSTPPALAAVQKLGIGYAKEFRINNSGFWLPDDAENNDLYEAFFNVGLEQFKFLFDALQKVQTKSTKQTRETLRERDNITKLVEDIYKNLKLQLDEIEFLKTNAESIRDAVQLEMQTQETIRKMKKSVERLKEIALNPKAIGDTEYFDFLINAEIQNQETGWQKRVTQLQKMKNDIGTIQSIINAKDNKQIQQK